MKIVYWIVLSTKIIIPEYRPSLYIARKFCEDERRGSVSEVHYLNNFINLLFIPYSLSTDPLVSLLAILFTSFVGVIINMGCWCGWNYLPSYLLIICPFSISIWRFTRLFPISLLHMAAFTTCLTTQRLFFSFVWLMASDAVASCVWIVVETSLICSPEIINRTEKWTDKTTFWQKQKEPNYSIFCSMHEEITLSRIASLSCCQASLNHLANNCQIVASK